MQTRIVLEKFFLFAVMGIAFLVPAPGAIAQEKHNQHAAIESKFSLLLPNGSLAELPKEVGPCNCIVDPFSARLVTPRGSAVKVRLPNAKAVTRLTQGDPVTVLAVFPEGVKPNVELFRFETLGSQRVTFVEECPRSSGTHLNVIPLRGARLKDGRWMLKMTEAPAAGEYCLAHLTSHKWYTNTSDDNYCFGIDAR